MKLQIYLTLLLLGLITPTHASVPEEFYQSIPKPTRQYQHNVAKLAKKSGPVGDYFKLKQAEVFLKEGKKHKAMQFTARAKEPIFAFWKKVLSAQIFLAKGKSREALALLRKMPPSPDYKVSYGEGLYENLFKRALLTRFYARKALSKDTKKDAAELIAHFPTDKSILELVGAKTNPPALTNKQKITKLHALHSRYKYKKVAGLITSAQIKSASLSKSRKCEALFELGNALKYVKGQRETAISSLKELEKNHCDGKYYPRSLYWLGSLKPSSTSALPDQREHFLKKLHKEFPNHRLTDDAHYKLYKYYNARGESGAAQKSFKALMALKKGDMKSSLLFDMAYPSYKKGAYKKAAQILAKGLSSAATSDESLPRLLYWYSRSLEKLSGKKNKTESKNTYKRLVKEYPYSFYAILAGKRISKAIQPPALPKLNGTPPAGHIEYIELTDLFLQKGPSSSRQCGFGFCHALVPQMARGPQRIHSPKAH